MMLFGRSKILEICRHSPSDPDCGAPSESPGPDARFPASAEGWQDALAYARSKKI